MARAWVTSKGAAAVESYDPDDPLATLLRWEGAGATWRLVAHTSESATVSLLTCDGGEEVSRFTTSAPDLLRFVAERAASESPA